MSECNRTKRNEPKGVLNRHSLCFLFSGLPFPAFSLLTLTSAKLQVQYFVSMSKDSSLKTPSPSADGLFESSSMAYFTYIGLSLNRSRSSGIRTILSTPGEDTWRNTSRDIKASCGMWISHKLNQLDQRVLQ